MLDEALRLEDIYLSTNELSGTMFSIPRAVGYFENIKASNSSDDYQLIAGANLTLKLGETICIGGPSGKGKSAILRMIAGLARPHRTRSGQAPGRFCATERRPDI